MRHKFVMIRFLSQYEEFLNIHNLDRRLYKYVYDLHSIFGTMPSEIFIFDSAMGRTDYDQLLKHALFLQATVGTKITYMGDDYDWPQR